MDLNSANGYHNYKQFGRITYTITYLRFSNGFKKVDDLK